MGCGVIKSHYNLFNFLLGFFLKIFEDLKAHISETETDINKRKKVFFSVLNGLSY